MKDVYPVRSFSIPKCHRLVKEGDGLSNDLFYVSKGSLLVVKGDVLISRIDAPAFAGEIGPILGKPRSSSIMSSRISDLDVYDAREFVSGLTIESDQGYQFLKILLARFESTRDRVDEFQRMVVGEYVKILAELVTAKTVADESIRDADIKRMRLDNEFRFQSFLSRKKPKEDNEIIQNLARQYAVEKQYQVRISTRFHSYVPMDVSAFKTPRLEAFLNFRQAAIGISEEIVVLTRYLAVLLAMDIDRLEHELPAIEEAIPFEDRLKILDEVKRTAAKKPNAETALANISELESDIDMAAKNVAANNGELDDIRIEPIATPLGVGRAYAQILRRGWKERLKA